MNLQQQIAWTYNNKSHEFTTINHMNIQQITWTYNNKSHEYTTTNHMNINNKSHEHTTTNRTSIRHYKSHEHTTTKTRIAYGNSHMAYEQITVQFSWKWYLGARKSPYALHPVTRTFLRSCLWRTLNVCLIDDGPFRHLKEERYLFPPLSSGRSMVWRRCRFTQ